VSSLGVRFEIRIGMGTGLLGCEYLWLRSRIGLLASIVLLLCGETQMEVLRGLNSLRCGYPACVRFKLLPGSR
jgi:hypothetical protein